MGWKVASGCKAAGDKLRLPTSSAAARSRMKLWLVPATTTVLLWTCVVQLTAVGDTWGPRVLKGWPSCLTPREEEAAAARPRPLVVDRAALPPKSESPPLVMLWLLVRFPLPCSDLLFAPGQPRCGSQLDIDSPPALWRGSRSFQSSRVHFLVLA